jgi:3-phenylpropionate/cinnamic acid dioxygenase small subunit
MLQPGYMELQSEIEAFFFLEADLLDTREYTAWLDLLADDITYFMPMRYNVPLDHKQGDEASIQGEGISWFDDDKWTLTKRVEQILTGKHYAEEPLSRVTHMISNVRLVDAQPDFQNAQEVSTTCRFLLYQNRMDNDTNSFIGRRLDHLRRAGDSWQIARREIILDQSILQAKNLTNFF